MKRLTLLLCMLAMPAFAELNDIQPEKVLAKCEKKFKNIEDRDYCISHKYGVPSYVRPQFVGCMEVERSGETGLIQKVSNENEPQKTDAQMVLTCLSQI